MTSGSPGKTALRVEWRRSLPEVEALCADWQALESAVKRRTVFSSHDYLLPWYRNYAPIHGEILLGVAWRGTELCGLAPLVVRRGRVGKVPVRRIDFAGHDAEAGEFLVPDDRPEVAGSLLESLADAVHFDVICLNNLDAASPVFDAVRAAAASGGHPLETVGYSYATVDLRAGYEAYCRAMSGNFRRNLKRQAERMREVGPANYLGSHFGRDQGQIADCVERLFAVANQSWKAAGRGLLAEHHQNFYRELATRFGERGMLDISILSIGGRDAAYVMGIAERGVYYDVTVSYDAGFQALSPGSYLMQELMRALPGAGVRTVVSHGDHAYKRRWATAFAPVTRAFIFSRGPRGLLSRILKFSLAPLWSRMPQRRRSS